ncbi:uncharacterized protein si:dkey-172h23.2 [Lampris incognitus]|uniref:uncharacterized protein si:dkey-172h23.2 n=1 Tax=Lampris incognitus TaxID=2546036 RepID=UPI0024B4FB7B|nr:uncharacterized protein si:dkey-172h23.2 [Lampris incognitus]
MTPCRLYARVSTAGRANGLEGALLLDECHVPLQECERLDESLALALRHLKLPPEWSLLGKKLANSTEVEPQETLLHFAARRGLRRVADFLLQQSGALEALRLANKQGHTPASIAEERGHTELHQLLTQAEADTETERGTLTIQPFTTYARVVCHLPKLKTHTLTVGAHPGHEPPTLQRSVEQLRHLICHLHAKGVPSLDLQSESLHTAPECSEGVETETACSERLQHWSSTQIQGCEEEHSPEGSSSSTVEVGQPGNAEIRGCSPFSLQTSEQPEDDDFRLHHSPNTDRDYCETREERREEGAWEGRTELLVAFDRSVSLCDGASGTRGETEGKSPEVGTPLPPAKGKQTAETDKEESLICQWLGPPERTDRFSREGEESLAVGEEESGSGCRNPTVFSRDEPVSNMGNVQLSENSEVLDTSDSDMEKCSQDGESVQREEEEVQSKQDPCGNLGFTGEEQESKGLIDPTSSKLNLSNSYPTGCGDVRLEVMSESVGPRPTIEGLGEGEYSSDINKIEQNQETAGRDYPSEEQCNLADNHSHVAPDSGGHSEDYSEKQEDTGVSSGIGLDVAESADVDEQAEVPRADIESTSLPLNEPDKLEQTCIDNTVDLQTAGNSIESTGADTVSFEPTEMMSSLGNGHTELDPGMTQQDVVQTKKGEVDLVGIQSAKTTGTGPNESNATLMPEESGLPLEQSVDVLIVTDSGEACLTPPDTEPESQPSPSLGTMEALSPEGTGKRLSSDSSVGGLSLETLFAESEGAQVMETVEEYLG